MEYKECERMAIAALRTCNRQVTDENIGIVIGYILTANAKYKDTIGNEFGFRKMYISFAIKSIKSADRKNSRTTYDEKLLDRAVEDKKHKFLFYDIEKHLTKKEYGVILSKYRDNKTLAHIGQEINCSTENVRLILKRTYKKLKVLNEYNPKS